MSAGITIQRQCKACGQLFEIGPEEQRVFKEIAERRTDSDWTLPVRCTPCRATRRRQRQQDAIVDDGVDEWIDCIDCGVSFRFGPRDKQYYLAQGFCRPRRCKFCRGAHRQNRAE